MKTKITKRIFGQWGFVATAVIFAACSGDDNEGSPGGVLPGNQSYIEGEVDSTQFNSLEIQGTSLAVATKTGTGDGTLIMISGSDMATNTMSVILMGITAPGEYTIDPSDDGSVLAYIPANSPSYDTSNCSGATGTLTVTTYTDEKIEGTFEFVGKDDENCAQTKTVTSGSFRGVYM